MRVMGLNAFPNINPRPPHPLDAGDSQSWLYELSDVVTLVRILRTQGAVDSLIGEASLGSGETIESAALPVEYLGPID
jgi:hypothetical protein